jgi:hypothetical protein
VADARPTDTENQAGTIVPYQADYVLRLIEQLHVLIRAAKQRLSGGEPPESEEVAGQAIGLVLGMDPLVAARLTPQTLTTMLHLGDVHPDVLPELAEAIELDAEILSSIGREGEAETRRAQAAAVRGLMSGRTA